MSKKWDDILIRNTLSDDGTYPASGSACHSPDIVPWGTDLMGDPVQTLTSPGNWMRDMGRPVDLNRQNYVYVRGLNLFAGPQTGKMYLYYSDANLLMYPSLWKNNQLKPSSGVESIEVQAKATGDKVATGQPFAWVPQPTQTHYCLVGRVSTQQHPNEIPDTGGITDFSKWVLSNPDIAWRNVSMVANDVPTFTITVMYNQGGEPHDMDLGIRWQGLPPGSAVAFSSGTPLPSGQPWELKKTTVQNSSAAYYVHGGEIPAGWKSALTYSYWANGHTPLPGFEIRVEGIYRAGEGDELFDVALPAHVYGYCNAMDVLEAGPVKMIILGGYTARGVDKSLLPE